MINYTKSLIRSPLPAIALVAIITFSVFARSLTADFLSWDDNWCIYDNQGLAGLSLKTLWSLIINKTASSSVYTPLTGLRWSVTYSLGGPEAYGFHLGNLLFHTASACLVFIVIRKLLLLTMKGEHTATIPELRINAAAAISTLLWSIHPLRVEPVAWAAGGAHSQAVFFMLFSLLSYLFANEKTLHRACWLIISVFCYAASVLSQPITLGLPAVLFILDIYPLRRIDNLLREWNSEKMVRIIIEKIPFAAIGAAVCILNFFLVAHVYKTVHAIVSLAEFGFMERAMQAFYIWAYYAWRPWYPVGLSPLYTTLTSFNPLAIPFVASAFFVIIMTFILILLRQRWPLALALWLWFFW